jgi:hypothetical protein
MSQNSQTQNGNPVVVIKEKQGNRVGIAGFILALIGLIFCWVPIFSFIPWILGTILSIIGCFRNPKGLAIAGTIISFISIILIIFALEVFLYGAHLSGYRI